MTKLQKKKSLINRPLIPLKIILFVWNAGASCLLPFMTLHMIQIGLTNQEMIFIFTILPVIQLVGTPIAGFMADRMGNYKPVLLISLGTCIVTTFLIQSVPGRKPQPQTDDSEESNQLDIFYMLTFWLYLIARIFHQVTVLMTFVLLDTTAIVLAEKHDSTYGRQRFWSILASGIFPPFCGFFIDYLEVAETTNYAPAFYLFNIFTALTFVQASMVNLTIPELPRHVWKNIRQLVETTNVWFFLLAVFILGSCWGFLESYLFIYLEALGAPKYMLGLTVTVGASAGLPFLYESDWFVKKFGVVPILVSALGLYFIRLIGYSLIVNPWYCLPFEVMEAFTFHLMWIATIKFTYSYSPPGMLATLQAVVSGLNYGVGRGFGSLIGGIFFAFFGFKVAFRAMGCMALVVAIIYAICYQFFLKKDIKVFRETPEKRQVENGSDDINNDEIIEKL